MAGRTTFLTSRRALLALAVAGSLVTGSVAAGGPLGFNGPVRASGSGGGQSVMVSDNAFFRHHFAEVGARPNDSFGSDVAAPSDR
jgi:hypothetical protein